MLLEIDCVLNKDRFETVEFLFLVWGFYFIFLTIGHSNSAGRGEGTAGGAGAGITADKS